MTRAQPAVSVLFVPQHQVLQLLSFFSYFAFFITNSRSLSFLFNETSWCPLRLTHLEMSSSDSGSSATIFSISPILRRSTSTFVRKTCSGQSSPLTSIDFVGEASI